MNPLNSPVETGVRVLMLLTSVFPEHLSLNQLVLLDHGLLHSADLGRSCGREDGRTPS